MLDEKEQEKPQEKAQKDQPEDADPAVCQDRSVRADFRRSCEPGIFCGEAGGTEVAERQTGDSDDPGR